MEALEGVIREFLCLESKRGKEGVVRFYLNEES